MRANVRMLITLLGVTLSGYAQWVNYPTPGIPRTADGKPNLTAAAPRTPDGKPDLSGLWQIEPSPWTELKPLVGNLNDVFAPGDDLRDFSKYAINILADFKPGEAPIRPEIAAAMRQRQSGKDSKMNPCLPQSISFGSLIPATM